MTLGATSECSVRSGLGAPGNLFRVPDYLESIEPIEIHFGTIQLFATDRFRKEIKKANLSGAKFPLACVAVEE